MAEALVENVPQTEAPAEAPKTILVAQQHSQDQNYARVILDKLGGFKVAEALSAADVIHRLQVGPDVILVDPQIEGNFIKAVEMMRRMPKLNHVGIAVLSGEQNAVKRCVGKGFNGFILKPYTPEQLLACVWKILEAVPPLPGDGSPAQLEIERCGQSYFRWLVCAVLQNSARCG
jgi:CheY-like chemotaxis protein